MKQYMLDLFLRYHLHKNHLYLIDQHAAMERCMYEKIRDSFKQESNKSIELLIPIKLEFSVSEIPLINEKDLADALNKESIAGAGLDVLSTEPPLADNPLLTAKNCFITPHIAWATYEARTRLMQIAIDNLKSYMEGNIINNVAR